MPKKLLWPGELARELGISARTVCRLADAGEVEVIRDAKGRRHFRPDAIHKLQEKLGLLQEGGHSGGADHTSDQV